MYISISISNSYFNSTPFFVCNVFCWLLHYRHVLHLSLDVSCSFFCVCVCVYFSVFLSFLLKARISIGNSWSRHQNWVKRGEGGWARTPVFACTPPLCAREPCPFFVNVTTIDRWLAERLFKNAFSFLCMYVGEPAVPCSIFLLGFYLQISRKGENSGNTHTTWKYLIIDVCNIFSTNIRLIFFFFFFLIVSELIYWFRVFVK